jgi:hypothetical protein
MVVLQKSTFHLGLEEGEHLGGLFTTNPLIFQAGEERFELLLRIEPARTLLDTRTGDK